MIHESNEHLKDPLVSLKHDLKNLAKIYALSADRSDSYLHPDGSVYTIESPWHDTLHFPEGNNFRSYSVTYDEGSSPDSELKQTSYNLDVYTGKLFKIVQTTSSKSTSNEKYKPVDDLNAEFDFLRGLFTQGLKARNYNDDVVTEEVNNIMNKKFSDEMVPLISNIEDESYDTTTEIFSEEDINPVELEHTISQALIAANTQQ